MTAKTSTAAPSPLPLPAKPLSSDQRRILDYLQHRLPGYPFNPKLDDDYVEELLDDFPDIDVLAEIKAFRWYYNNRPFENVKKPRVVLRRWISNAWPSDR